MLEASYFAMGTGVTSVGIGLALFFQGQALKRSTQTQDIGKKSSGYGIVWLCMGGLFILAGLCIYLFYRYILK